MSQALADFPVDNGFVTGNTPGSSLTIPVSIFKDSGKLLTEGAADRFHGRTQYH